MTQSIYIVGSRYSSKYGGFETFVEKLTNFNKINIQYYVACMPGEFSNQGITADIFRA